MISFTSQALRFSRFFALRNIGATVLAAAAALLYTLAFCHAEDATKKATLLIYSNAPSLGDAPYWIVPHGMGYFAEEGLEVEPIYAKGAGLAIQVLAAGDGDFALSVPDAAMAARQKGVKVKSVFLGNRSYGSALVVPKTANINSKDELREHLRGGAIGVLSMSSGRIPYARAWIQDLGLVENQDVRLIEVGEGAQAAVAVELERVQALVMYDAAYAAIETASDIRFKRFETEWQDAFFSGMVLARDETIESDPDLIVRYGRAVAKGLIFTLENPEAAVRIFWNLYPENKPAPGQEAEAMEKGIFIVRSMHDNWSKGMDAPNAKWGGQVIQQWEAMQEFSASNGLIPERLAAEEYFTNDFNDEINDFDVEVVRLQAAAK